MRKICFGQLAVLPCLGLPVLLGGEEGSGGFELCPDPEPLLVFVVLAMLSHSLRS